MKKHARDYIDVVRIAAALAAISQNSKTNLLSESDHESAHNHFIRPFFFCLEYLPRFLDVHILPYCYIITGIDSITITRITVAVYCTHTQKDTNPLHNGHKFIDLS